MVKIGNMHTYKIGDRINDPFGNTWVISAMWTYENWLCMGLLGADNPDMMGGYRIKVFEVLWN
jgi:hypothetical protein